MKAVYRGFSSKGSVNTWKTGRVTLLQPNYSSALSRSKTRTCFKGITPEEWVKHFYDELRVLEQQKNSDVVIFDNSEHSVEESVEAILNIFHENNR